MLAFSAGVQSLTLPKTNGTFLLKETFVAWKPTGLKLLQKNFLGFNSRSKTQPKKPAKIRKTY